MFRFFRASFHVSLVSLVNFLSHLILVAVILSVVRWLFIAFIHLFFMCQAEWSLFLIALLHLRAQIRWLASDMIICSSLVCPIFFIDVVSWPGSLLWFLGIIRHPIPIIRPINILGHDCGPYGHSSSALVHIR